MDPNDPSQSTPIVPNIDPNIGDIQEMDLDAITGAYDDIGQSLNQMGQNSVADIASRQRQLIGSDFSTPGEGPMGDYNESTYIEPVVTSAQSTVKQIGTQVALNEGIRRSEEAAEEKLKETQKQYNEWVAEQNRKAAEAAANSARSSPGGWGQVHNNTVSQETLDKHKLSLEDFIALDEDVRKSLIQEDYDRRAGIDWNYQGDTWYQTVDRLYKEFGISGDAAKDERTGKQTQANKDFWKRADVSKRFGEVHAEVQGFGNGAQIMQQRQQYVKVANEALEKWINPSTPEEKAISFEKLMKAIDVTVPVKQAVTAEKELSAVSQIEERLKQYERVSQNALSDDEKRELARIADDFRTKDQANVGRLNELLNKAGAHTKLEQVDQGFFGGLRSGITGAPKFEVQTGVKIVDQKIKAADIIESALGLTAQELKGIREIKDADSKEFERIMKVSNRVLANNYITISDGQDKADNYFRNSDGELELAGINEVIIHYMPSAENDPALADLRKYLKDPLYMEAVRKASSGESSSEEDKQKLKRFEETAIKFRQNQLMVAAIAEGRGYTDNSDIYSAVLYDAGSDNDTAQAEIAGRKIRDWLNEFRNIARNDQKGMSERYLDLLDKANSQQGGYVNVDGSWTPLNNERDEGRSSIGAPRKHFQDLSNEQAMALFMIIKKEQDAGEFSNNFLDDHQGADSGLGDKMWHAVRSAPDMYGAGFWLLTSGVATIAGENAEQYDESIRNHWAKVVDPARSQAGGAQRHDEHAYDIFRNILDVQYTADTGEEGWYGKESDKWVAAKRFGGDISGFGADLVASLVVGGVAKTVGMSIAKKSALKIAGTYGEQLGKNIGKEVSSSAVVRNAEGVAGIRTVNGQIKTFEEIGSDLATAAMNGRSATNYLKELSPTAFKGLDEKQVIKMLDDAMPKGMRGVQARHRIWQANLRQSNANIAGYTSLMVAGVSAKSIAQASPQALRAAVQIIKEGGKDGGSVFSAASRRQVVADAEKKIAKMSDELARGTNASGTALTASEMRSLRARIAAQRRRINNPGSPAIAREYGFQSASTVAKKLVDRAAQTGASGGRMSKYEVAKFLAREGSDSARKEAFIKRFLRDEALGNALFFWGDQRNAISLETGEHRWEQPGYVAEALVLGTAFGAGIHLAGGPTQSIKRQLVNDRIQRLRNSLVKNGIDPENKAHVRKMNEIARLTRYADKLMDDAMTYAGNPDQVAIFKKTAEEAKEASRAVLNSLQEVRGFADSSMAKSVDELMSAIAGRAGYETRLMRTMTSLRGESHTDWVRRTSTMRNLASIDNPEVNAMIMKSGFDSLAAARSAAKKELSPKRANEAMDKGLVDGLVAHGVNRKVAEQEIRALRAEYDDKWAMIEAKAKEGVISLDSFGGRKRGGYISPAGMTHTMVDDLGPAEWGLIFERKVNADVAKPTIERQADMGKVISDWLDGKRSAGKGVMKVRNPEGMNLVTSLQTYSNMVNSEVYLRTLDANIIRNGDVIVVGKSNLDKAIADDLAAARKDLDDYTESLTKDGTRLLPQGAIRMGAGDPVSIAAKKVADIQAKLDGANGIELSPVAIEKAAKALRRSTEEFSTVYKAVSKIFEDNKNNILKGEEGLPNLARYTDESGNYTREGVLEATFRAVYKRNPAWKAEGADSITGEARSQYFKGMSDNQQIILAKRLGDDSNMHTRELINEARRHFAEVDGGEGIFGVGDVVQYAAERTPLSTNAKRGLDSVDWVPLSNRLTRQGADDTIADMALDNSLDSNTKLLAEALGVERDNSARLRTFENADTEYISAMANDVSKHKGNAKPDGEEIEWEEMADIISSHRKRFGEYVNDVQFRRPGEMPDDVLGTYSYTNDLITISLGASKGTYDHESVHRAIGQFLTADEINTLYRSVTVAAGGKKRLRELYETPDGYTGGWKAYAEEHLGNVFSEYIKGNVHLRNISKRNQKMQEWAMSKGLPLELVQIIGKLVDRIEGFVHGSLKSRSESRQYVIDFFDKLESGGFANAKPTPTVASEVRTLARTRLKDAASGAVDSVRFEMEHAMKLFGLAANSMTPVRRRAAKTDVSQDRNLSLQDELDQITGGAYVPSVGYEVDSLMRFKELPTAEKQAALDDLSGRLEAMNPEKGPGVHTDATNKHQRNLREIVADNNLRDPDFDESPMFRRITDPETPKGPKLAGGSKYLAKDQAKSDQANRFIGRGSKDSSTARYAAAWGDRANTGQYSAADKVFVSVEGNRTGRSKFDEDEVGKAVRAGATIITDNAEDRARAYNVGERELAEFLERQGYKETAEGNGIWTSPASASTKELENQLLVNHYNGRKSEMVRDWERANPAPDTDVETDYLDWQVKRDNYVRELTQVEDRIYAKIILDKTDGDPRYEEYATSAAERDIDEGIESWISRGNEELDAVSAGYSRDDLPPGWTQEMWDEMERVNSLASEDYNRFNYGSMAESIRSYSRDLEQWAKYGPEAIENPQQAVLAYAELALKSDNTATPTWSNEAVDLGTMRVGGRDVPVPALTENGVIMPGVKAPEIYVPRADRAKKGETLDTPGYEVGLKGYAERTSKKINDKLRSVLGSKVARDLEVSIDDALSLGQMPSDGTPFALSLQLFYDKLAGALRAGDITPDKYRKVVDDTYEIVMGRPRRSSSTAAREGTTGTEETDELRELREELNEFKPVGKEDGPIDPNASSLGALLESEFEEMRDAINYNQEYGRPLTDDQRRAMAAHNEVINNPNSTDEQVKEATENIHKLLRVSPSGDKLYEPTKLSYSEYSEIAGDPLARFYADITDEELAPAVKTLKAELKAAEKELADAKAAKKDEVSISLGPIRNVNENEVANKVAELSERVARIEAAKGSAAYVNRNGLKFIGETNNLQGYSAATTLTEVEQAKRTTQEGFHPIENRRIRRENKRKGAVSKASVEKRKEAYDELVEMVRGEKGANSAIDDSEIMIHQGLARVKSIEQKQFSSTQGFQKAALATAGFAKAVQNVQLSAGYSRYNAYSFRYLVSAMMSNPRDALPLLKSLRESKSIESVNKFYMENQDLFIDVAQKTGDPFYIQMFTDSVSQRAAFDSGYLSRALKVGEGNAKWHERMDLNTKERRKELADEGSLDTWRNAPKYDSTTAVAVESGAARRTAKTVANFVEATWDDPTFKRFMPVLSGTLFLQNYKAAIQLAKKRQLKRVTAAAKNNGGEVNPADLMLSQADIDNAIMMAHVRTKIFFHPAAAKSMSRAGLKTLMAEGSYDNAAIDRFISKLTKEQVEEITDANQGMNAGKIVSSLFFAMQYKATQIGQIANGIAGIGQLGNAAARGTNVSFTQQGSRNLAFSMLTLTAAAMIFNEINGRTQAWDDPARLLTNLNEIGKFRLGDGDGTPAIDPFFSQFTLLNSLFRVGAGLAGVEGGTGVGKSNPHRGIGLPGTPLYVRGNLPFRLGAIQDEVTSNLLSPFKAAAEVFTNNTYFGGNIWEHATKLDGTPNANYDPGRNVMAGAWHLLGFDKTNAAVKGDNLEGDKINWVGGSGLVQHPYIEAFDAWRDSDYGEAVFQALELPIKWDNLPGRAKSSLNGFVVDTIAQLKSDYDAVVKNNPGNKVKIDEAYRSFTEQSVDAVAAWSAKYGNVLEGEPRLVAAAQRILTGFFADHYDDNLMKMQNAYWKASIESGMGFDFGWDPRPNETEDELAARIEKSNKFFFAERDKERDARDELKRLGFDVGDRWAASDEYDKYRNVHRNVITQFERLATGKVKGYKDLRAEKKNYEQRIKMVDEVYTNKSKAIAKKTQLAEQHNQAVFDLLAPYVDEYGPYTLQMYDRSGSRGLGDLAAELLIIPADVLWKYGTTKNPAENYLKDHFGVGWSNNSNLPSDAVFQKEFEKMTARVNRGELASASKIIDNIIKGVQTGKYGVTGQDWSRTLRYREIINGRIGL